MLGRAPGAAGRRISSADRRSGARKSLLNSALSGLTAATRVMRRKSWPLGDHLRAHQHVDLAGVHRAELRFQRALSRVLSASMRAMRGSVPSHRRQQRADLLFQAFGAAADRCDVEVAAVGQARGTRSVKPQWWQRSVRSNLWNTRQALQCGQPLFQPQSAQCSTGA